MSSTRGRSAATEEAVDNTVTASTGTPANADAVEDATLTEKLDNQSQVDPAEDDVGEQTADSGESSHTNTSRTRGKKRSTSKSKKVGGRLSRSRIAKNSQSAEADDEAFYEAANADEVNEESKEEGTIKLEEVDIDTMDTEEGVTEEEKAARRQRSVSGIKELAGLGLQSLGDGQEEPLMPRRSRRSAMSPNESSRKGTKEEDDAEEPLATEDQPEEEEPSTAQEATEDVEIKPDVEETTVKDADDETKQTDDQIAPNAMEEEDGDEGITRCLCGSMDENVGLMIQCDECKCWQHCICMGMMTESQCPDVYYCEQCRPELHVPLLRLLGVLPSVKGGKKGSVKTHHNRQGARDSSKELKEAKEAVLALAKENEKRRQEGRDPVTGWTVMQQQERDSQHQDNSSDNLSEDQIRAGLGQPPTKRQHSDHLRSQRSTSRDDIPVPKSPPKRRSTMNSRDSVYGWEPIPPGLLNEDEVWEAEAKEGQDESGRKRKRGGRDEENGNGHTGSGQTSTDAYPKRRRTSPGVETIDEEGMEAEEEEELSASQMTRRGNPSSQKRNGKDERPKHPNQYTKRAAAAAASGSNESSSGPSPHKTRGEGYRRSARETAGNSRTGTPVPGEGFPGRRGDTTWGIPEHLSHLSFLLPPGSGPEALKVTVPATKAGPKGSASSQGGAVRDSKTDRIIKASPQPFNIINLTESTTKIKYPGKRMTMGEMRKRVRNILEFVSRLQIESVERERRMRFLGITRDPSTGTISSTTSSSEGKDSQSRDEEQTALAAATVAREEEAKTAEGVAEPQTEETIEDQIGESKEVEAGKELVEGQEEDVKMEDAEETKETEIVTAEEGAEESKEVPSTETEEQKEDVLNTPVATEDKEVPDVIDPVVVPDETPTQTGNSAGLAAFTNIAGSSSMALVDELTRELLSFQSRFGTGNSVGLSSSLGF